MWRILRTSFLAYRHNPILLEDRNVLRIPIKVCSHHRCDLKHLQSHFTLGKFVHVQPTKTFTHPLFFTEQVCQTCKFKTGSQHGNQIILDLLIWALLWFSLHSCLHNAHQYSKCDQLWQQACNLGIVNSHQELFFQGKERTPHRLYNSSLGKNLLMCPSHHDTLQSWSYIVVETMRKVFFLLRSKF